MTSSYVRIQDFLNAVPKQKLAPTTHDDKPCLNCSFNQEQKRALFGVIFAIMSEEEYAGLDRAALATLGSTATYTGLPTYGKVNENPACFPVEIFLKCLAEALGEPATTGLIARKINR